MSADLLEAFGGDSEDQTVQPPTSQSTIFNDNSPVTQRRDTGLIHNRRIDPQPPPRQEEALWTAGNDGNDVLFDAADEETIEPADDDFGDFEDVQQPGSKSVSRPLPPDQDDDWGDFEDVGSTQPEHSTPVRPRPDDAKAAQKSVTAPQQATTAPEPTPEDDWAAFEDGEPEPAMHPPNPSAFLKQPPQPAEDDDDWDAFEDGTPAATATMQAPSTTPQTHTHPPRPSEPPTAFPLSATRPTNIPPPSTILSLLPSIYSTLSHPTATTLLHLYQATARITAARPQRWRRDTVLAQSTRIAPASASGKSSGMKL